MSEHRTEPREPMLQFFEHAHLRPELATVSKPFCDLAHELVRAVPRNPERTVALRKLLEAKDCAVRAILFVGLALLLFGCGGNAEAVARETIATAGEYRAAIAEANADAMRLSRQADIAASATREEWERRRAVYYRVEEAGRVLEGALRATEAALNAADSDGWHDLAGCVIGALIGLQLALDALDDMGVNLPLPDTVAGVDVSDLLGTLSPYAGYCPYPIAMGGAS